MKILFISDLHGNYDLIAKLPQADELIIGGDFVTLKGEKELRQAIAICEKAFPTFKAVSGNMDPTITDQVLQETGHALAVPTPLNICGLKVCGMGGANHSPFNTPNEWDENTAEEKFASIQEGAIDIMVTHAPPLESGADKISSGICVGSSAIAGLISRVKPAMLLCGHIHEAAGIYRMDSTIVINPGQFGEKGSYACIQLNSGEKPFAWLSHCI